MKRIATLSLLGAGSKMMVSRGNLQIGKGKRMMGIRLKVTCGITNNTGGSTTLTDVDKQQLFTAFQATLNYGRDGSQKPYPEMLGFDRFHREFRYAYGSEIEGYSDATNGLAKSLPNAATTNVVWYHVIPTGKMWFLSELFQRLLGMGRSQCASAQLEIQLTSNTTIRTNLVIATGQPVTIEVYPDVESCKGDQWGAVPFYRQFDSSSDEVPTADGLPLRISERSAVHASSLLTSFSLRVDDEVIHEAVSAQDMITEYNDAALAQSAGSLVDRETVLYFIKPDGSASVQDLPTGTTTVKQVVKTLNPIQLSALYLPKITDSDVANALGYAVSSVRNKELKAVSLQLARGQAVPERMASVLGFLLVDRDDREFETYPGWRQRPGDTAPVLDVPQTLRDRAGAAFTQANGNNEAKVAAGAVKAVAAAVPGGVSSTRGFSRGGSAALAQVQTLFR